MISIDEMEKMLNEIADGFPSELYKDLNGGIILLPEAKLHPKSLNNDLFIMGEYHHNINMGRYIVIYYGSFSKVYNNLSKKEIYTKLSDTIKHEFVHHMESLSGLRDLEVKDEQDLNNYKNKNY